jgi:hypothetical protein
MFREARLREYELADHLLAAEPEALLQVSAQADLLLEDVRAVLRAVNREWAEWAAVQEALVRRSKKEHLKDSSAFFSKSTRLHFLL